MEKDFYIDTHYLSYHFLIVCYLIVRMKVEIQDFGRKRCISCPDTGGQARGRNLPKGTFLEDRGDLGLS